MTKEIIQREKDGRIDELEAMMYECFPAIECPVEHKFTEGMYIREIVMPAESLVTSKIHKTEHPYVLSKGKMLVSIDGGEWTLLEAPFTGITKAGTRRIAYVIEDCVWTTFHLNPNNTENVDEIEEMIIEKHDNPLLNNIKNIEL
jgi:hypothetical protein